MATWKRLSNPPIHEAILDFRFNVPEGVGPEQIEQICAEMAANFPEREVQHELHALLDLQGADGTPVKATRTMAGIVLKSADKSRAVIVRRNSCTASHIGRYSTWEELEDQARKLFEVFVKKTAAQGVTRVAARFINHLPLAEGVVNLDELLTHGPKAPDGAPETLFLFTNRIGIVEEFTGLQAVVGQSMAEMAEGKGRGIVIDSDVSRVGSFEPDFQGLQGTLAAIRDLKNRIFFGSLTDQALEPFI